MDAEEIVTEVALSGGDENECQQACSNPGTNSSAAVTCPKVNIRNLVASTVREVKSMDEKTGKRQEDAMWGNGKDNNGAIEAYWSDVSVSINAHFRSHLAVPAATHACEPRFRV
jgi:hypothetical protein